MTEIINRQRKIKIERQIFEKFAATAFQAIPETGNKTATIAFVSDSQMQKINKEFRGKNSTTDVLQADPCVMVIFGATGDLTKRKLFPALYNLAKENFCPKISPSSASDGRK
jgi:uncharacterized NAD(P)/FAD-binding protein YdhS